MKRFFIIFVITLCFCGVKAQDFYNNQIHILNVVCQQKDSMLHLEIVMNAYDADISSRKALLLTPTIRTNSVDSALSPIFIAGKNRTKADRRKAYFKDSLPYETPYITVKPHTDSSAEIHYVYDFTYQPWMQNARIELKEETYGCAGCKGDVQNWIYLTNIQNQNSNLQTIKGKPVLSYIRPKAEAVKTRYLEGRAYLDFPVNKSNISTDFRNNFKELSKILNAINQLRETPNAEINKITLQGFASPEGDYKNNERLADERSQALKNYLQKEYGYPNKMFKVSYVVEDWPHLRQLLNASGLPDKEEIINIIDNVQNFDAREDSIKALRGGEVYKTLLQNYYPQLRHVDYKLSYTIRAFSVEEGKKIIKKHPGQMSLNEMFLVANTYTEGSEEFNQVFDIAVRMYPGDTIANINAAAIALEKNDLKSAHKYLDSYQNTAASWNNQGVLYMLENNPAKAKEYFLKAKDKGSREAIQNLTQFKLN